MSEHLAGGSSRLQKTTCRKCNRTIYVFVIDGARTETDSELITVISDERPPSIVRARRAHAELCEQYLIAISDGILGIQACAGSSHAARRDKILAEPRMLQWLQAGGRLELWSWSKRGPRGARKSWTLRAEDFQVGDFECATRELIASGEASTP